MAKTSLLVLSLVALSVSAAGGEPPADRYGDPLPKGAIARMGSVRLRWPKPLDTVVFAPDNRTLAVIPVGTEQKLSFVDVATGKTIRRRPLTDGAPMLASTTDNRFLAVHRSGSEFRILDATTGKKLWQWQTSVRLRFSSMALSPDGKVLAAGESYRLGKPNHVHLWDVSTGKKLATLNGHQSPVYVLAFTRDGKQLLSASEDDKFILGPNVDGTVCAWEIPSGKLLRKSPQPGRDNVFSPDGKVLAYRDENLKIRLHDLDAGKDVAAIPVGHPTYLFLPDGRFVTGSKEEMISVWDAAAGRRLRTFEGYLGNGTFPRAVSPDGKILATFSHYTTSDYSIRLWDVKKGVELRPFGGHRDSITGLDFAPDGKRLVSGSEDRTVRIWDTATGKELRLLGRHQASITAVAFSPDGKVVASGDENGIVLVWSAGTGKLLQRFRSLLAARKDEMRGISALRFGRDGKTLIAGSMLVRQKELGFSGHGELAIWDPATGKTIEASRGEGPWPIAFSPDADLAATAEIRESGLFGFTGNLRVRHVKTGRERFCLKGDDNETFDRVFFSPDGKTLAVHSRVVSPSIFGGRSKGRYRLMEVESGRTILQLDKDFKWTIFAPDGRVFAGARGKDYYSARLVVPKSGKVVAELSGHVGLIHHCVASKDGKRVATGSADHSILVWDVSLMRRE